MMLTDFCMVLSLLLIYPKLPWMLLVEFVDEAAQMPTKERAADERRGYD